MSDTPKGFLLKRAKSYLRCDHGDGLNHASFDVEKLLGEYAAAVLEDVANTIMAGEVNGVGGSLRSYGERWFATKLSDQLRARATEERER